MTQPLDEHRAPQFYRIAWVLYLLIAIGGLIWIGLRDGGVRLAVFLDLSTWWFDLLIGGLSAGLLLVLWDLARRLLPTARELEDRLRGVLQGVTKDQAVGLALMSGFAEELLFRGAIQPSWGLLPATVLFALLHSGRGRAFLLWTIFAAAAGLLFGALALWRGNLLAPVTAHILVNAINLRKLVTPANESTDPAHRVERAVEKSSRDSDDQPGQGFSRVSARVSPRTTEGRSEQIEANRRRTRCFLAWHRGAWRLALRRVC